MDQLEKAIDGAEGALALVIRGAGDRAFVSGGDLKELSSLRTTEQASAMAWRMRSICDRLADFPGPVIAALNGHALGGGAEVAVAADIRVAADDIKIGFNQVALAIMPAWVVRSDSPHWLDEAGRCYSRQRSRARRRRSRTRWADRPGVTPRVLRGGMAFPCAVVSGRTGLRHQACDPRSFRTRCGRSLCQLWIADAHWAAADRVMKRSK